jgi:large subunit ribosomal protein L25
LRRVEEQTVMQTHTLTTEARDLIGKNAARQLRARGLVPAVFYGRETKPSGLAVSPKELTAALSTPQGRNALITINVGGQDQLAMVQDLQIHPVTRKPLHVDFYRVDETKTIVRKVPFIAEGKAKGVVAGGELVVIYRDLELRAKPGHFPASLKADVTPLEIGDHIKVKDLALPEGVELVLPPERNVVSCVTMRKRKEEEEAPAPGAAGATPAAGASPSKAPSKAPPAS